MMMNQESSLKNTFWYSLNYGLDDYAKSVISNPDLNRREGVCEKS